MKPKVIVIGSSNTDLVIKTDRFPLPGETLLGGEFFMFPGGKGANQAVAAARLGADVTFVCKLGNDLFGDKALAGFIHEGIHTEYITRDTTHASGVALITVNGQGENTILVASGANYRMSALDLEKMDHFILSIDCILLQLEVPLSVIEYILNKYPDKKIILNPAPAAPLPESWYSSLFFITPNEHEAELLTGIKVYNEHSACEAAVWFRNKGVKNIVITLGSAGAYLHTEKEQVLIPAEKVNAIDSTAAGDIFNGACAVSLASGLPFIDSVKFACKAAALSVTRMGAQSSAPYLAEMY